MYLVLCSSNDASALWAFEGLRAAGLADVELLTGPRLAVTRAWEHRLGRSGIYTSFALPDGRIVRDAEVRGVLNRLVAPPEELIACACQDDHDYTLQELTAFYLSWLHGLPCQVLNRPAPQGLAGRWRHASEWCVLTRGVGLPAPPFHQTGESPPEVGYGSLAPEGAIVVPVVVLEGEVFGATLPTPIRAACSALMRAAETSLLGIDLFVDANGEWGFANGTPMPNLMIGGEALLDGMVRFFTAGGAP